MGPLHCGPTPPREPFPERTPLTARAEGKQEVDKKKNRCTSGRLTSQAVFQLVPWVLRGCGPSVTAGGLVSSYTMISAFAVCMKLKAEIVAC